MLRFRDLGASFSSFGCFVFEFWVLRASVFVFECFVFETTVDIRKIEVVKFRANGKRNIEANNFSNLKSDEQIKT